MIEEYLREHFRANWEGKSPIRIRRFRRINLAALFNILGFKKGAEIGIARGIYSRCLFDNIPSLILACVDPYKPYSDYRNGRSKRTREIQDAYLKLAQKALSGKDVIWMKMTSMEAINEINDESFDFVYIDGNHFFEFVKPDLIEWSKKVRIGGIVSGHDYHPSPNSDVVQAVDEFVAENGIDRWFISDESAPSYFWQKK